MSAKSQATPAWDPAAAAAVVPREVERMIQRQVKGLEYISTDRPDGGQTPKDVIYRRGTLSLYHYRAQTDEVYRVPVLFIMSLVSRGYILDLAPGQSFVEYLVKQGFDVYMIDWGVPRPEDRHLRIEDYVLDFMPDCIERVLEDSGEDQVSLLGYCMGGLFSALYGALHTDGPLKNMACLTTPVDFHGMGLHKVWTDPKYFDVDGIVDRLGNVPPELMLASFDLLRPVSKMVGQIRLWDNMWNDDFVTAYRRIDRWSNDQIPFAGEAFRQMVKDLMQQNKLIEGTFELGGRKVDLGNIRAPLLHVVAQFDHIVPYESAKLLVPLAGSEDKTEECIPGGHVSLVAGRNAITRLWPRIEAWLSERSV